MAHPGTTKKEPTAAGHSIPGLSVPPSVKVSPGGKPGGPRVIGFGSPMKRISTSATPSVSPKASSQPHTSAYTPSPSRPATDPRPHTTTISATRTVKDEPGITRLGRSGEDDTDTQIQTHSTQPQKNAQPRDSLLDLFSDSDSDAGKGKGKGKTKAKASQKPAAKAPQPSTGGNGFTSSMHTSDRQAHVARPASVRGTGRKKPAPPVLPVLPSSSEEDQDVDNLFSSIYTMGGASPVHAPSRSKAKMSTRAPAKRTAKSPTKKRASRAPASKRKRRRTDSSGSEEFEGYNTDDMIDDGSDESVDSVDSETQRVYSSITNKIRQEQQDRIEADKTYRLRLLAAKLVKKNKPRALQEKIQDSFALSKVELPRPQLEVVQVFINYRGSLPRIQNFELKERMPKMMLWDCLDDVYRKPEAKAFIRGCSKCDFRKLQSIWVLSGSGDAGIRLAEGTTDKNNWIIITAAEVIERVVSCSRQMGSAMRQKYPPLAVDTQRNRQLVEAICCDEIVTGRLRDHEKLHKTITRSWLKTSGWMRSDTDARKMYRKRSEYGYKHMSEADIRRMGNVIDYVSQDWKHFPGHTVTMPDGRVHATSGICARGIRLAQKLANLIRAWAVFPMHLLLRKNLLSVADGQKLTLLVTLAVEYWTMKMTRYEEYKLKITHKNTVKLKADGKSFMTSQEVGQIMGRALVPSDQEMDGSDYSD